MWLENRADYEVNPLTAHHKDGVHVGDKFVRFTKGEIPDLVPASFWDWLNAWLIWRDKGLLPLAKGWAEHPHYWTQVMRRFDGMYSRRIARERGRGT